MPGAGKSTIGVLLAKELAMDFIDTDIPIQISQGHSLQHIVETQGYQVLRKIEQQVLLDLNLKNHVIATGGSAVYGDQAMQHLKSNSLCIFLHVPLEVLQERISNYSTRGLAKPETQTLEELYQERLNLYQRYMDIKINCAELSVEQICTDLTKQINNSAS